MTESIFLHPFIEKRLKYLFSPSNPTEPFNPTAGTIKPDF